MVIEQSLVYDSNEPHWYCLKFAAGKGIRERYTGVEIGWNSVGTHPDFKFWEVGHCYVACLKFVKLSGRRPIFTIEKIYDVTDKKWIAQ
jgi:hypothetical protein